MTESSRIGVIGSGSWATALIKLLQYNLTRINWYVIEEGAIDYIKENKHNPNYLTSVELDNEKLHFYNDINEILEDSDALIVAVPAAFVKNIITDIKIDISNKFIISAVKGIIPDDNLTVAEFFNEKYNVSFSQIAIISGPCHAEEVALERLSYLTIASKSTAKANAVSRMLECRFIKTRTAKDIYGTEYAAILKNIIAIASGICHGLGYGDNFQAVLVSNAIREIKRFLDNSYPGKRKINSSAYLGDLLVTTYSQFSRNRTFGTMIGKGYSVNSAMLEMSMVAEGYYAVASIHEINKKYNIEMPITKAVYNILYERISPVIEIRILTDLLR